MRISRIVLIFFLGVVFLGCGEKEVTPDILLESPEDYVEERVQVHGEIDSRYTSRNGNIVIALRESGARVYCHFPINEPPPSYLTLGEGDMITISGIVKFDSDGDVDLAECHVVE